MKILKVNTVYRLTIDDVKIMLDNNINVCAYGGAAKQYMTIPHVFIPYDEEGNYRKRLINKLEKLGFTHDEDVYYWSRKCNILIFETAGDIDDDVMELRKKYNKRLLKVGGITGDM